MYSGGEIGLDQNMIKLAEEKTGGKYEMGTDEQKSKIHDTTKDDIWSHRAFWALTSNIMVDSL